MAAMREVAIDTPRGPARAHLSLPGEAATAAGATAAATGTTPPAAPPQAGAALVLGHGAGGGIGAPDIQAAARAALARGFAVALVEQPYRVAGRRAPAPATHLDDAWRSVIEQLRARELAGLALVTGGRSMGARVACRTAAACAAVGVLCLAFPLQPPARTGSTSPTPSRLPELEAVTVPTLVIQGRSDRFGIPPGGSRRTVVEVAGDHGLKRDLAAVEAVTGQWLAGLR
jgi:predicted alpha/beta-hydrolase family hydrolase